jgi:SnoaL-like domain
MDSNIKLLHTFYSSFANKDYLAMQACYHPDAKFSDPVFRNLSSKQVKAMWHMLTVSGSETRIAFSGISADDLSGKVHWEAWYTFSLTKKKVHNIVDSTFEFKDGLILSQKDSFNFYRWAGMAFGGIGKLIGWTPLFHQRIQQTANKNLVRFISNNPEYQ